MATKYQNLPVEQRKIVDARIKEIQQFGSVQFFEEYGVEATEPKAQIKLRKLAIAQLEGK